MILSSFFSIAQKLCVFFCKLKLYLFEQEKKERRFRMVGLIACAAICGMGVMTIGSAVYFIKCHNAGKRYDFAYLEGRCNGRPSWVPPDAFVLDLHFHTNASPDGVLTPEQAVRWCIANGYNGMAVTDHNTTANCEAVKEAAARIDPNFLVIPGFEWTTLRFHANIFGLDQYPLGKSSVIQWPNMFDVMTMGAWARAHGGFMQYNHAKDPSNWGLSGKQVVSAKFDAVEIVGGHWDMRGDQKIMDFCAANNMSLTGGTDTHTPGESPRVYTAVNTDDRTVEGVLKAIRLGKTTVYCEKEGVNGPPCMPRMLSKGSAWDRFVSALAGFASSPSRVMMKKAFPYKRFP